MIEVVVSSGDRAEAETPERAAGAALTLIDEAREAGKSHLTASFYNDGRLVLADVSRAQVAAAFTKERA